MIEAYAFVLVFTVQILAISLLHSTWFIRHVRVRAMSVPAERFEQLYPGSDREVRLERVLTLYRVLNIGVVVLGLALLGWLFSYMQRPDWDDGPVESLVTAYFAAQMVLPLSFVAWISFRYRTLLEYSLDGKRKAVLQRRGLFDFVSPLLVCLALSSYFLFVGFVLYIQQDPFPGFAGYINIGGVTFLYAWNAFGVYGMLYGRKNPLQTHADRVRSIGLGVKAFFYSCIVCVAFMSLSFTLQLLDLERWEPVSLSICLVTVALLCFMGFGPPPRQRAEDGLGSSPA